MLGWRSRNLAARMTPPIPSKRLTANESRVMTRVTSSTRTGIMYQRAFRRAAVGIVSKLHQSRRRMQPRHWVRIEMAADEVRSEIEGASAAHQQWHRQRRQS